MDSCSRYKQRILNSCVIAVAFIVVWSITMLDASLARLWNSNDLSWLYAFYSVFFFFLEQVVSCLHCKQDTYWISTRSLFSGADYARKMHHIFLCYGLLLTRDSKLFIINLISLRAISSSVAGVLSIKDQICWFVFLKAYFSVKCFLLRKKKRFMCYCVCLFIFIFTV